MNLNLIHLEQRIKDLEVLADEVINLAEKLSKQENVQPELSQKGQRWYRGAREILVQQNFSGLKEFDSCYHHTDSKGRQSFTDIERYINYGFRESEKFIQRQESIKEYFQLFHSFFQKARSLLYSVVEEVTSREIPITTELSFHVSANEFEIAKDIFDKYNDQEVLLRVSGVISRIPLERHLLTVIESRRISIVKNPPHKKSHDFNDITTTLSKNSVIAPNQKSELDSLYGKGNNCAHPKEQVIAIDVKQLIERGRELASMIL